MEGGGHPLYGGPSYNYTYGSADRRDSLDFTEQQYYEDQALQQSLQQQQFSSLDESSYQVDQSFSKSYLQRFGKSGAPLLRAHSTIAEEDEFTADHYQEDQQYLEVVQDPYSTESQVFKRNTDAALLSWGLDGLSSAESQMKSLNFSTAGTSIDLILKRGHKNIKGLHKLAAQGDRSGIMQHMKQEGPDAPINELDVNNCTPLMYAAVADSRQAIEMLLNFSAKREQTDVEGRTAVHYAAFFGKHRALKFLIDTAADWNPRDRYGRTPLHWACAAKGTRCLEFLLKHAQLVMGNLNPVDNESMTPLHCAALFNHRRHILLLHEAGCNPSLLDCENKTPLHWTAGNPDPACMETLVNLYPSLLNQQDVYGMTLLHEVARNGNLLLATALLSIEGIDIDAKDNLERTALHWACAEGYSEITGLLLRDDALDSCIDSQGLTALHYSVHLDSVPSLQAFVQLSDLKHLPDNDGITPLMHASAKMAPGAVQVLLKSKAVVKDIDRVNAEGRSSLHLACLCGADESVEALLSKGADPNLQDAAKQTPIFLAAQNGHGGCMQHLIACGAEMDVYDADQQTPLHKAVLYLQMEAVQVLAMNRADLNMRDQAGNTALHMAVYSGNNAILEVLVEQSANPNLQNDAGACPLHLAATEGYSDCVETLLNNKAYVNFIDFSEERYTPLDYAQLQGHTECVQLLLAAGGVGTKDIEGLAARTIQKTYRGYKARQRYSQLIRRDRAATLINKHVRGFLQIRRYRKILAERKAAIMIQARIRGFLQMAKFKIVLARARKTQAKWKLMEDFSSLVDRGRENGLLRTFVPIYDLTPDTIGISTTKEEEEHERRLRFEASMEMRALNKARQQQWREFREGEQQRREDKARAEEMSKLKGIVQDSRARKEYTLSKLQHRKVIRSHWQAAVTIQRAYIRMKKRQREKSLIADRLEHLREKKRQRAARVIQRAWRRYWNVKVFKARHFMSVMTEPVLDISKRLDHNPTKLPPYQRGISITGSPKRKIHRTLPGEFKMLRPRTRELLLGSTSASPPEDQTDGKKSERRGKLPHRTPAKENSPRRTPRKISSLFLIKPERDTGKKSGKTKETVILPKLLTGSVKKEGPNQMKTQEILQLPQIH